MVDGTCAFAAILMGSFGSLVSFGTLISAFGPGPIISFFDAAVSGKLIEK